MSFLLLQANNFETVPVFQHFIKMFDSLFYNAHWRISAVQLQCHHVDFLFKFLDRIESFCKFYAFEYRIWIAHMQLGRELKNYVSCSQVSRSPPVWIAFCVHQFGALCCNWGGGGTKVKCNVLQWGGHCWNGVLKFIYPEKTTKFCKISTLLLTGTT